MSAVILRSFNTYFTNIKFITEYRNGPKFTNLTFEFFYENSTMYCLKVFNCLYRLKQAFINLHCNFKLITMSTRLTRIFILIKQGKSR